MITPLAPNSIIRSRYLIVQMIGQGSRGDVYLAVDQRAGSAIAIKRVDPEGSDAAGTSEREAVALTRLNHPVLPKVTDHFTENGHYYLVMEHISGDNLAVRLESSRKPFPVSWVMFWADQILDALNYLHSHVPPIYHGDVNPGNLKLTADNHIVLLDCGLSAGLRRSSDVSPKAAGSDASLASQHYPSPEQLRGAKTEASGDVYSLSATLYQLVTNTLPADPIQRVDSISTRGADPLISPATLNHEVSPAVAEIIIKGMALRPNERFSSAVEMQRELRKAFNLASTPTGAETAIMGVDATPMFQKRSLADDAVPAAGNASSNPMEATLHMGSDATEQLPKQSDVRTEVFKVYDTDPEPSRSARPSQERVHSGGNGIPMAAGVSADPYPSQVTQVAAVKKKSSKAGLFIGLAAGLLLLVVVAAGGGWFVYRSYNQAPTAATTPSPVMPSATSTPSEVIVSQPPTGNGEGSTPSTTESYPATDDANNRAATTPTPQTYAPPPPRVTARNTPSGSTKPPTARTTPKPPPPRDDRTVILQ